MTEAANLREIAQRLSVLQMTSSIDGHDPDRWCTDARQFVD